jgi:hypothetical protein
VVLILAMVSSALMAFHINQLRGGATLEESLYIRSPKFLKFLSLGFTGLVADIYWTRAVQYFGAHHQQHALRYDLLAPLLELTTDLDPHLTVAYEFGSFFLAQKPPEGAGMPDEAVKFVERGIQNNPNNWRLYYHLGFIQYIEREDYKAAADAFLRGSKIPGAHPWMKIMAATMSEKGGDIQTSRFLWTKIYESSDDKQIRQNALVRLVALRVDEDVTALEQIVQQFRQRRGAFPQSWQQLIEAGSLRGIPADPSGEAYRLISDGEVLVQSPQRFPFIRKGLPKGATAPEIITPDAYKPKSPVK